MATSEKRQLKQLQALIDRTVQTGGPYYLAQEALNDFCQKIYGTVPGEIDADEIIDAIFLGCGAPAGMSAEKFDQIMRGNDGNA